jgi:broad specificity phosphatase PhoE
VIVAHGGILSGLARGIAHEPDLAAIAARRVENCSVSEFTARLGERGPELHLRDWAACEHLS